MGTAILAPLVARPLLCTARVRRAADFASFTFAPASEQKRLPRTPPSESAVIVRCTLSRWTINPNRLRSSGPSVRSRIGQIFCADENRRKPFTGATNALRALPAVTSFGASADGWNCAIAAPIAYKRPPRFTKRETVNRTVSVPICFVSFVLCCCVEPLEVAVDAPRASMAVATIAAARARYLRDIVPPLGGLVDQAEALPRGSRSKPPVTDAKGPDASRGRRAGPSAPPRRRGAPRRSAPAPHPRSAAPARGASRPVSPPAPTSGCRQRRAPRRRRTRPRARARDRSAAQSPRRTAHPSGTAVARRRSRSWRRRTARSPPG